LAFIGEQQRGRGGAWSGANRGRRCEPSSSSHGSEDGVLHGPTDGRHELSAGLAEPPAGSNWIAGRSHGVEDGQQGSGMEVVLLESSLELAANLRVCSIGLCSRNWDGGASRGGPAAAWMPRARSPLLLLDAAPRRPWLTRDGEGERESVCEGRKHRRSKF